MNRPPLFYPCLLDPRTGRINVPQTATPCTREQAEAFLRAFHWQAWLRGDAIPQPAASVRRDGYV